MSPPIRSIVSRNPLRFITAKWGTHTPTAFETLIRIESPERACTCSVGVSPWPGTITVIPGGSTRPAGGCPPPVPTTASRALGAPVTENAKSFDGPWPCRPVESPAVGDDPADVPPSRRRVQATTITSPSPK